MLQRADSLLLLSSSKTIGFFTGLCLLFNSISGPGIPFTPQLFSTRGSGIVITLAFFLSFSLVSGVSALLIIEAMQAVPGNKHFQGTVEFGTLINFYFGKIPHLFGQFLFYGAIQSIAVQSIVISSQTTDNMFISLFGRTCGLSLYNGWICIDKLSVMNPSPFQCTPMIFTLGIIFILVLVIPMGYMNLDDNISVQVVSFLIAIAIGIQWVVSSILMGWNADRISVISGNMGKIGSTAGTVILNLGFTIIVPSWINLKKNVVNVQRLVWAAVFVGVLYYTTLGISLAFATEPSDSGSVFSFLQHHGIPTVLTKITIVLYAYLMLVTGIPIQCIISHQNFMQNKIFGKYISIFASFILPWLVAALFQTGVGLSSFITWTSAFFVAPANFIVPVGIYFSCVSFRRAYNKNRYLTLHQQQLLKMIHWSSSTISRFIDESGKESTVSLDDAGMGQVISLPQNTEHYGLSNSISHQSNSKNLRNRTSTNSNSSDETPSSPQSSIIKELATADAASNDQTIHDQAELNITPSRSSTSNGTLSSKLHLKVGRSSTDTRYINPQKSPKSSIEYARRGSATTTVDGKHFNIPKWLYEDVPDPDYQDWGENLGVLIGLIVSDKAKSADPNPVELQVIREADEINVLPNASQLASGSLHQKSYQDSDGYLVPPGLGFIDSDIASLHSVSSLPIHPNYVGPVFRSIPTWIPIRTIYIASFLLILTVALNIMIIATSISTWSNMPRCSDENNV